MPYSDKDISISELRITLGGHLTDELEKTARRLSIRDITMLTIAVNKAVRDARREVREEYENAHMSEDEHVKRAADKCNTDIRTHRNWGPEYL